MATRTLFLDSIRQALVSDLVSLRPTGIDALTEGDTEIGFDIYSDAADTTFASDSVKLAISLPEDSSGSNRANAGTTLIRYTANLTAGPLVVGKRYLIQTFATGDNFTNVGATANASGDIFTASGTTPTTWTNGSILWLVSIDLDYNFTLADLQAAIRDMSSSLFGGLTVTGASGSPVRIVGGTYANLADFSFDMDNLSPQCEQQSLRIQNGDGLSKRSIQRLSIAQVACALATSASAITAGVVTLVSLTTGVTDVTSAVVDVLITGSPYAGTVTFAKSPGVSAPVAFNASGAEMATAVDSLYGGTGLVSGEVIEAGPVTFRTRLTFDASLGNVAPNVTLLKNGDGVIFGIGRRFSLDLDTINMIDALQNVPERTLQIELQRVAGSKTTTAFQNSITITNDLIANASPTPLTPGGVIEMGAFSISAAGSTSIPASGVYVGVVTVTGGPYTHNIYLPLPVISSLAFIKIILPATAASVINIRDASAGGTILATFTTDGSGVDGNVTLIGSQTAWQLLSSGYNS